MDRWDERLAAVIPKLRRHDDKARWEVTTPLGIEENFLVPKLIEHAVTNRLLTQLGVKTADPSTVIARLQDLHLRSPEQHRTALASHAWFIFNHRSAPSAQSFDLKVVTTDNSVVSASQAYMDHPIVSSPSLSGYLSRSIALFIHRDYDSYQCAVPAGRFLEWKNWLHHKMQVRITPRIYPYPEARLSDEFRLFLTSATTDNVLRLLTYMSDELCALPTSSDALKELRGIPVVTTDRVSRPLETTYIPRRSLTRLGNSDLPFLPIPDPESPRWEYLRKLGVSFEVNSGFYLKQLIRLSQRKDAEQYAEQDTKKMVSELYKQLDARFNDDGLADAIRYVFFRTCVGQELPHNDYRRSTGLHSKIGALYMCRLSPVGFRPPMPYGMVLVLCG